MNAGKYTSYADRNAGRTILILEGGMGLTIGLDVGTTNLGAVVLDVDTGRLLARATVPNTASRNPAPGRAELDLAALEGLVVEALRRVVDACPRDAGRVRGIGITGQMHGVALLRPGRDPEPFGPAITWQDRRALEAAPGTDESCLARLVREAGGPEAFERMGCLPAAGYLGPTLYWLRLHDALPSPAVACFIPDAAVSMLTGEPPRTEPTDGGSSGIFDIVTRDWGWAVIERLGLSPALFPPVGEPGDSAGGLRSGIAHAVGLPPGVPVGLAMGDNQASFLGSVSRPEGDLLLNVGTGAQISARADAFSRVPGLDTRYYHSGRYLLVGAGLFGGRTLAYLRDLFRRVGLAFYGSDDQAVSYDAMCALAAAVPPGSEGLRCVPAFTGTREDPDLRAVYSGLTPENLTPGHLTRATLEGMAESFHAFYARMRPLVGERDRLVGSGNGIALNPLFARILAHRFGLALHLPALQEEAATGAALLAAVGAGEVESPDDAAARLSYREAVPPEL